MKKYFLPFLTVFLLNFLCDVRAQNTEWTVISSSTTFKIKNAGFTIDGCFTGLKSVILFDAKKSFGNSIEAKLEAGSINTGNSTRDGHLKNEEYFDVANYPSIVLSCHTIAKQSDGSYKGYFKLTLKNTTKDVVIPFVFTEKESKGIFKGTISLNRLNYGVGSSSMVLSDNVGVTLLVNVIKK